MKKLLWIYTLALSATILHAAVIQSWNFGTGYTNGYLNGQNGWFGAENTSTYYYYSQVQPGSLSFGSISGGTQDVVSAANNNTGYELQSSISFASQTNTVWASVLYNRPSGVTSSEFHFTLGNAALTGGNSYAGYSMGARLASGVAGALVNISNGGSGYDNSLSAADNQTHLLVFKVSKANGSTNYNRVDVWIDPTETTLLAPVGKASSIPYYTITGLSSIDTFFADSLDPYSSTAMTFNWGAVSVGTTPYEAMNVTPIAETIPVIFSASKIGTNFVCGISNQTAGSSYCFVATTNLTIPLANWTPLLTNTYPTGAFYLTNAMTPGVSNRFYTLAPGP